jgi:hypothetical protein
VDARGLWPSGEPFSAPNWWGWLAGTLGAEYPLKRPFLIGIRGVACSPSFATETHETVARPAYDDTFVFLSPQPVPPYVFAGATHPYQRDSKLSPDIDGDGRGDVGCIRTLQLLRADTRPGETSVVYEAVKGSGLFLRKDPWAPGRLVMTLALESPCPVFTIATVDGSERIPCVRDTDHDGKYSPAELTQASFATAVLFHTGFDAPPDSQHRSSIACQTCNVADLRLMASHARAFGRKIDYVPIEAKDALALLEHAPFHENQPEGGRIA